MNPIEQLVGKWRNRGTLSATPYERAESKIYQLCADELAAALAAEPPVDAIIARCKSHLCGGIDEQLFPELADDAERRYEGTIAVLQSDIQALLDLLAARATDLKLLKSRTAQDFLPPQVNVTPAQVRAATEAFFLHKRQGQAAPVGDWLESQEFYEMCQTYRHLPVQDQGGVVEAFNGLREAIRKNTDGRLLPDLSKLGKEPQPTAAQPMSVERLAEIRRNYRLYNYEPACRAFAELLAELDRVRQPAGEHSPDCICVPCADKRVSKSFEQLSQPAVPARCGLCNHHPCTCTLGQRDAAPSGEPPTAEQRFDETVAVLKQFGPRIKSFDEAFAEPAAPPSADGLREQEFTLELARSLYEEHDDDDFEKLALDSIERSFWLQIAVNVMPIITAHITEQKRLAWNDALHALWLMDDGQDVKIPHKALEALRR